MAADDRLDAEDELDWDRERDGRMRDYATDDADVPTVPYTGGE